jgi:hypothetical protein
MPRIAGWENFPGAVQHHLIDRMRERQISLFDLNLLRRWVESKPEAPEGEWFKDFGSFKVCGRGQLPKTFLLRGQVGRGKEVY